MFSPRSGPVQLVGRHEVVYNLNFARLASQMTAAVSRRSVNGGVKKGGPTEQEQPSSWLSRIVVGIATRPPQCFFCSAERASLNTSLTGCNGKDRELLYANLSRTA
jgi:hypothetical protein